MRNPRSAADVFLDLAIRHAILLYRLQGREADEVERVLRLAFEDLAVRTGVRLGDRFARRGPLTSYERSKAFRELEAKAKKAIGEVYSTVQRITGASLEDLARYEAAWTVGGLDWVMPVALGLQEPSVGLLRSIVNSRPFQGRLLADWWKDQSEAAQKVYARALSTGLTLGESNQRIAARVSRSLGINARQASDVMRTAVRHVTAHARMQTFIENGDIVKGYAWVSTLDARTTIICIGLDGRRFEIGKGPMPPAHFNCRSDIVPELVPPERFGLLPVDPARLERAAKDYRLDESRLPKDPRLRREAIVKAGFRHTVPQRTTYGEWLRSQPRAVQDEVLGPARARLWRSGAVDIDRFVGSGLRPLNLAELARREGLDLAKILGR